MKADDNDFECVAHFSYLIMLTLQVVIKIFVAHDDTSAMQNNFATLSEKITFLLQNLCCFTFICIKYERK